MGPEGPPEEPRDFGRKLGWGQIAQRAVEAGLVVVIPEGAVQFPGVLEVNELVFVETLARSLLLKPSL